MFATAMRCMAKKLKPKLGAVSLKTPPEQTKEMKRILFDIVKEHGPITVANAWERVKEVGSKDLTSKTQMKLVLRWMRERKKLRLTCNHAGAHKQFLYTTLFDQPSTTQPTALTQRQSRSTSYLFYGMG